MDRVKHSWGQAAGVTYKKNKKVILFHGLNRNGECVSEHVTDHQIIKFWIIIQLYDSEVHDTETRQTPLESQILNPNQKHLVQLLNKLKHLVLTFNTL